MLCRCSSRAHPQPCDPGRLCGLRALAQPLPEGQPCGAFVLTMSPSVPDKPQEALSPERAAQAGLHSQALFPTTAAGTEVRPAPSDVPSSTQLLSPRDTPAFSSVTTGAARVCEASQGQSVNTARGPSVSQRRPVSESPLLSPGPYVPRKQEATWKDDCGDRAGAEMTKEFILPQREHPRDRKQASFLMSYQQKRSGVPNGLQGSRSLCGAAQQNHVGSRSQIWSPPAPQCVTTA